MFDGIEGRIDRIVERLLKGRPLRLRPGDAAEREAIMAAARLAAAREGYPRLSPAFRRKLAGTLAGQADPARFSRRTALGAAAGLAAGLAGAAALGRLPGAAPEHPAATVPPVAGGVMKPGGGSWIPVASFSQLVEGAPTKVVAGDIVAYLFRKGDQVSAVSGICTHWPCVLEWKPTSGLLNCPCHTSVDFGFDGTAVDPVYPVPPLPAVAVKRVGDQVLVFSP